ncbi:MAG: Lrp/AsnC family transcriptional regulator [Phycisphaerae bacterium]
MSVITDEIRTIDETDLQILSMLQDNGRLSNAEMARRLGMAASAVLERVRKLEERGVIQGYTARLCPAKLGCGLLAFVLVRTEERVWQTETGRALTAIPQVQEVHHIAGEDCFLVKVRARDTESLGKLLREQFGSISTIRNTRTTIVLNTEKQTAEIVLGQCNSEVNPDA